MLKENKTERLLKVTILSTFHLGSMASKLAIYMGIKWDR